ncbi:MAG: histidine kinase, partial [Brevundimonas sp.]
MTMSRVLEPTPVAAPEAAPVRPLAAGPATSGIGQPLAPIFTAMAVMVLTILALTFARSADMVAALWGAGGVAVAVW